MPILLAQCPRCRAEVNTGISADDCTMLEVGSRQEVVVRCDDCRTYHLIKLRDLYFAHSPNVVAAEPFRLTASRLRGARESTAYVSLQGPGYRQAH
jgi:hypothetical protein